MATILTTEQIAVLRQCPCGKHGHRLKIALILTQQSASDIAKACGVNDSTIRTIISPPKFTRVKNQIAATLGCSYGDLFHDDEIPT